MFCETNHVCSRLRDPANQRSVGGDRNADSTKTTKAERHMG